MGAFLLYLFGVLGYLSTSHRHADGSREAESHSSCQLCQVSHQAYLAPEASVCLAHMDLHIALIEAVWAPILASRHPPFASRAPPSA
ncbi:MAG: hypothetical protein JF616_15190 [Fibrobacteres bacterium]|nr:hypothetical protein [Fibrobacterota bacterium]